jgi:RNA polymerase sigma-70 factor (ECF subfamily)
MSYVPAAEAALARASRVASDEAAFITDLRAGSEEAFAYLLGIYQTPVFDLVLHIVEDPSDAADVLQDVFVKVFRKIGQFQGDSSLKTWIYRIAIHEASNHRRGWLRRFRREPVSLDEPAMMTPRPRSDADTPYEALEKEERQRVVRRALASLAAPYRTVVVLREIEGMSYEEISQILGIAEGTVKSRLVRGRDLLRRKLNGYHAGSGRL